MRILKKLSEIRKKKKSHVAVIFIIYVSLLLAIFSAVWEGAWIALFVSSLTLVLTLTLTFLPFFIQQAYKIKLPTEVQIITILFLYASLFLGIAQEWYSKIWWWSYLMHGSSGIALGLVGFLFFYILYKTEKLQARPLLIVFLSFCFALAMGTIWEIFEFSVDSFFGEANMQRTGTLEEVIARNDVRVAIYDTMWDLILDSLGALVASVSGYVYLRKGKVFFFGWLMDKFDKINPRLSHFRKAKA